MATILKFERTKTLAPAEPHPLNDLSFIKRNSLRAGIDHWNVQSTGDHFVDLGRGRTLASEYLDHIGRHPSDDNVLLLGMIVIDMIEKQTSKALVIGFMTVVAEYAMASARLLAGEFKSPNT